MQAQLKVMLRSAIRKAGFDLVRAAPTPSHFHSPHYLRHNARRLEHLASLRIPVAGSTVLEVGAGIGDHTHYFTDRGCKVTITEARWDNLDYLRERYPGQQIRFLDMEDPKPVGEGRFDVVHCYGLLYHLGHPESALEFMGESCSKMLFLETCVSFGDEHAINIVGEDIANRTQAFSGRGCRPTRPWLFDKLKSLFAHVYVPKTQPNHDEFPLDWSAPEKHQNELSRAVFIASRAPIDNDMLVPSLVQQQVRHP